MSTPAPGVTRRTLARGAAWSVPAVAVAAAAPAYAVSGVRPCVAPPPEIEGCKYPGNSEPWEKTFRAPVTFTNNCAQALTITLTAISWGGCVETDLAIVSAATGVDGTPALNYQFTIASGGTHSFHIFWRCNNSGNDTLTFTYSACTTTAPVTCTNYTASSNVTFGPDCDCTLPLPPYPRDNDGCDGAEGQCPSGDTTCPGTAP